MSSADLTDPEPPTSIDPYAILSVPDNATPAEIKTAYKKLALRLHPDKAAPADRPAAHKAFQDLAFAYAILSDERRRKRYDATGNTSESLDLEDGDFDWRDFFRAQFAELVTLEKIDGFKLEYQGSEEERRDVLKAYEKCKGNLSKVFQSVMLSSILDDEERFRGYIDKAIEDEEVEAFMAYVDETEKSKEQRRNNARKEKAKAEKRVKDEEEKTKKKTGGGDTTKGGMADLAALIQNRGKSKANSFLDNLEAKYAGGTNGKKKSKKEQSVDEPSEEAFAAMAKRKRKTVDEDKEGDEEEVKVKKPKSFRRTRGKKAKV